MVRREKFISDHSDLEIDKPVHISIHRPGFSITHKGAVRIGTFHAHVLPSELVAFMRDIDFEKLDGAMRGMEHLQVMAKGQVSPDICTVVKELK